MSCQLVVRVAECPYAAKVEVTSRCDDGLAVGVRRVGYVPVPHNNTPVIGGHFEGVLPGFVGDPLFDEQSVDLRPGETAAFWLTVRIARNCKPGPRKVRIAADFAGHVRSHELIVQVADLTVRPRRNFHVTNWFYADAICDYYKLKPFEPAFWPIAGRYFRNLVAHAQDTLYVPVLTPPVDGVKRPTQLCKVRRVGRDRYRFDFADVRKWIRLAERCGIRRHEFNHLFTQGGATNALRAYHGQGADERLLWRPETPATAPVYQKFLAQYLPALERFCRREGILERSFFHLSDEPHGAEHRANYAAARAMVARIAPSMKVMDALSEIDFAREGLVDMPVPLIGTVMQFIRPTDGKDPIHCWTYFCCSPRGKFLNRLLDTPLAKIRMSGWLFYRTGVRGFLHWGYNYWYKHRTRELIDPFTVSDAMFAPRWPYGDTFLVYPGPDGPIDSVRWEVFAESLQDYALLQTLGVSRDDRMLSTLRAYDDFPFSPAWIAGARRKLLATARK